MSSRNQLFDKLLTAALELKAAVKPVYRESPSGTERAMMSYPDTTRKGVRMRLIIEKHTDGTWSFVRELYEGTRGPTTKRKKVSERDARRLWKEAIKEHGKYTTKVVYELPADKLKNQKRVGGSIFSSVDGAVVEYKKATGSSQQYSITYPDRSAGGKLTTVTIAGKTGKPWTFTRETPEANKKVTKRLNEKQAMRLWDETLGTYEDIAKKIVYVLPNGTLKEKKRTGSTVQANTCRIKGMHVVQVRDPGDFPTSYHVFKHAAELAGCSPLPTKQEWKTEITRMEEAGSLHKYLRVHRKGARFLFDAGSKAALYRVAADYGHFKFVKR